MSRKCSLRTELAKGRDPRVERPEALKWPWVYWPIALATGVPWDDLPTSQGGGGPGGGHDNGGGTSSDLPIPGTLVPGRVNPVRI